MTSATTPFISLMYHNVCESRAGDGHWPDFADLSPSVTGYFVDRQRFAEHCQLVARSGQALGVEQFLERSSGISTGETLSPACLQRPRVLVTFDDGWRGTVEFGGPILAEHGMQAMLFVTTDLIGHPHFVDRQLLQRLPETFVVGSHAQSHRLLADLPDEQVRTELSVSKAMLEDILGREVDAIAYPGGSFDRRVLEMTREAGYRLVFTSTPSVNRMSSRRPSIGRVAVKNGTSVETLERWLRGDVRREQVRAMVLAATKRFLGGSAYRRLRSRLISEDTSQLEMTDLASVSGGVDVEAVVAML